MISARNTETLEEMIAIWEKEGLSRYISPEIFRKQNTYGAFDAIDPTNTNPFIPEISDLLFLYKKIRERKVLTVLEFGVGYSTLIIGLAIKKNKEEFFEEFVKKDLRCSHPFTVFSLESDKFWLAKSEERIPEELKDIIKFCQSDVEIGTFQDRICHFYTNLPDIIPDFIYLDGPAAFQVQGVLAGSSFNNCHERTVMAADILRLEPIFVPGTYIVVDGRMNNVRFIKNNLQRRWIIDCSDEQDRTVFELREPPLGIHNKKILEFHNIDINNW